MLKKMDAFARKSVLARIKPKKAKLLHLEIEKAESPGEEDKYLIEVGIEAGPKTAYAWVYHCEDLQEAEELGEIMDRLKNLCEGEITCTKDSEWLEAVNHMEIEKEELKNKFMSVNVFLKMKLPHYGVRNFTTTAQMPKNRFENYSGPISMTVCASYPPGI